MGTNRGAFRFPNGPTNRIPSLDNGRAVWASDIGKIVVGGPSGNIEIANKTDVDALAELPWVETFTASEGQTVITLEHAYAHGALTVEIDNVPQTLGESYTEIDSTSFAISEPLMAGQVVKVTVNKRAMEFSEGITQQITNLTSQVGQKANQADLSKAQLYKLTDDDGDRIYLTTSTDLFSLKPGHYEIAGSNLLNKPFDNTGFIEVDVTSNTTDSGTRTQYRCKYSYINRVFEGTMHTGGDFRGWYEIQQSTDVRFYMESDLNNFYEKVMALQNQNTKAIGFITDSHYIRNTTGAYGINGLHHIRNIVDFSKYGALDFLIHGGDLINGKTSTFKSDLFDMVKAFHSAHCPKAILKGNHDFGGWYNANISSPLLETELSPLSWYNRMVKPFKNDVVVDAANPTGGYFYKDFDDVKLRVICLNTSDIPYLANGDGSPKYPSISTFSLSNAQLNWLANTALMITGKTDNTNWNVVIFSHVPLYGDDNGLKVTNGNVAHNIIKAFKAGTSYTSTSTTGDFGQSVTVDFTGKSGRHVANISGHYHDDKRYVYDTVQYMRVLLNAQADLASGLTTDTRPRTNGTALEDSWNVFTIDTNARKLYKSVFGQGDDAITISY